MNDKIKYNKDETDTKTSEVKFKTTENGDAILIEFEMDLPEGVDTYDENNLQKVVVPDVPQGKAVYIS